MFVIQGEVEDEPLKALSEPSGANDPFLDEYEFVDDVHGPVHLNRVERDVVDTPEFQRLFRLSQLGFVDLVYPTANHTRGAHSIGACFWAKRLIRRLNSNRGKVRPISQDLPIISPSEEFLISLGALTHDLPHGPFSHDIERKTHIIYPDGTDKSKRKVFSHYGPYDKHDNFSSNPALFVFLMDEKNSVLARVLKRYSPDFAHLLLRDAETHEHLADFARFAREEWPDFVQEGLPSLLFHLLFYEKPGEARSFASLLVKSFETRNTSKWGIGKKLHEMWYQPFRHDIIGDTLSADLLDYLMRDQSRLGMKNELDLKLLKYYVLVEHTDLAKYGTDAIEDEADLSAQPRFGCAIDLYDHKRGTFRSETLNDLFRLLDLRHQIHEKAVYHRVVQSAIAMLSRSGLILKKRSRMPRVAELYAFGDSTTTGALGGDERFLDLLIERSGPDTESGGAGKCGGAGLHQSIPYKLAERRVYRPLMVIPGDRIEELLVGHFERQDDEEERLDLTLRELAAIVDSTYFSRFFLTLSALIEALLKHGLDSEADVDKYVREIIDDPKELEAVSEIVPKGVIFWTTPYKQLYKDPAILVCANEHKILTIDELRREKSVSKPLRRRVEAGIADAESKNEALWKLYVFVSDGLFYTGACAKVLRNHPCASSPDSHKAHLVMAQNIVIRAVRCAWEYWLARKKAINLNASVLNASVGTDELTELLSMFAHDQATFRYRADDIRKNVSAVDVGQYVHGDRQSKCRDVRYKFDSHRTSEDVLADTVPDPETRELVRRAIGLIRLADDVPGEELAEVAAQFGSQPLLAKELIEIHGIDDDREDQIIRRMWMGELSRTSAQTQKQSRVKAEPQGETAGENRMNTLLGVCKIVLKKGYSEHEQTLISLYEDPVGEFTDEIFESKIAEFKRSVDKTPKAAKQRRAEGSEDSDFIKLKAFLNKLFSRDVAEEE